MLPQPIPGEKYDRLTVVKQSGRRQTAKLYLCYCVCGSSVSISAGDLRRWKEAPRHRSLSCGCARGASVSEGRRRAGLCTQDGLSKTREYHIWIGILSRCLDPKTKAFADYGGRGIKICDAWRDNFQRFLSDMGSCPPGLTIERVNNDGDYCPENCRWDTRARQNANTRKNRVIEAFGEKRHMADWCRIYGIGAPTFLHRVLKLKWPAERALTTKPNGRGRRRAKQSPGMVK